MRACVTPALTLSRAPDLYAGPFPHILSIHLKRTSLRSADRRPSSGRKPDDRMSNQLQASQLGSARGSACSSCLCSSNRRPTRTPASSGALQSAATHSLTDVLTSRRRLQQ
eukprot:GHVU01091937.1.p2 GENE.GHVU01091937.1~~GHVU01091937.1.p2  ORF type:complete len:111 (-),score=2.02 GHVU01091937.1:234-566(-)